MSNPVCIFLIRRQN